MINFRFVRAQSPKIYHFCMYFLPNKFAPYLLHDKKAHVWTQYRCASFIKRLSKFFFLKKGFSSLLYGVMGLCGPNISPSCTITQHIYGGGVKTFFSNIQNIYPLL